MKVVVFVKASPSSEAGVMPSQQLLADMGAYFGAELTPELREKEANLETSLAMERSIVQPYLFFGGRCEEALAFYTTALSAKVVMVMRFNESTEPTPPGMLALGFENKVMHCSFQVGGMTLLASDGCDDKSRFDGFRLALSVPSEAVADLAFNALAAGGKIDMPLVKTFWSPRYGMVTDKFGVAWMVMVPGEQNPSSNHTASYS